MKARLKNLYKRLVWEVLLGAFRTAAYKLPAWEPLNRIIVFVEYFPQFHRFPDLAHPKSFNEKIQHRKLYNRNPLLTQLQDKYRAREYVAERIGEKYLAKNYLVTDDPDSIDLSALPDSFVFKATHGCGWNIFVNDKRELDLAAAQIQLGNWLRKNYYHDYWREWAYRNIQPLILVEEYLGASSNEFPRDFKFRCFGGKPQLLLVTQGLKPSGYTRLANYELQDSEWVWIRKPIYRSENSPKAPPASDILPANIAEMTAVAGKLAQGLDYLRVDLYNLNGRIVFGEFTLYDGGGYLPLRDEVDLAWGQKWQLVR